MEIFGVAKYGHTSDIVFVVNMPNVILTTLFLLLKQTPSFIKKKTQKLTNIYFHKKCFINGSFDKNVF